MSNTSEIRWRQRLEHFERAVAELEEACSLTTYSKLERAGLVQTFERAFALASKTLKDVLSTCRALLDHIHREGTLFYTKAPAAVAEGATPGGGGP